MELINIITDCVHHLPTQFLETIYNQIGIFDNNFHMFDNFKSNQIYKFSVIYLDNALQKWHTSINLIQLQLI